MRKFVCVSFAIALAGVLQGAPQAAQDADRAIAGGGITVAGWTGAVDTQSAAQGRSIKDSKFDKQGDGFHLLIGPAAVYWNPANTASGDYTVKATFNEPKMAPSNHPHPMGMFIGGSRLGTPQQSFMYCTAYRDGSFIVRRFNGNSVTQVVRKSPNAAVKKAAGPEDPVTQDVAWQVKGGKVDCLINGTSVASFDKAD